MVEIDIGMKEDVRILREPQKAVIVDVSTVGFGIIAPIFFPKNALLVIDMDASVFNIDKHAKIIGNVRYCRPAKDGKYKVGVKFVEIEKPLLVKIREYVERQK